MGEAKLTGQRTVEVKTLEGETKSFEATKAITP